MPHQGGGAITQRTTRCVVAPCVHDEVMLEGTVSVPGSSDAGAGASSGPNAYHARVTVYRYFAFSSVSQMAMHEDAMIRRADPLHRGPCRLTTS